MTLTLSQVLFAILAMAGGAGTLGAIIAAGGVLDFTGFVFELMD